MIIVVIQAMRKLVVVGLEPTGNYHRVLAHRLIAAGFNVRLISSIALARTREALPRSDWFLSFLGAFCDACEHHRNAEGEFCQSSLERDGTESVKGPSARRYL